MASSLQSVSFSPSPETASWHLVLFEHLDEFAKLAWYLVADGRLVEDTFSRTMAKLDLISCDSSEPALAYTQARDVLIAQAIAVLSDRRREEDETSLLQPTSLGRLPDLPRLAFMLRLIIRSPETEVAKLLNISPSDVQGLVKYAIDRLSIAPPVAASTGWHAA